MSSAALASSRAHAHAVHPDRVRIAALSAAIAVNLTVFLAATRPLPPMPMPRLVATAPITARFVPPEAQPLPPPPPPAVTPLPRHSQAVPTPTPARVERPSDEGREAAPPVQVPTPTLVPDATPVTSVVSPVPVEASLAYRTAPLRFPPEAVRRHMHGTVLLRVLVDEQGRPVEAVVERSSGYGLLDRSAREQVLAGWRFQPASVGGHAVRAWARIPVSFELQKL
ncbi:energy transducer TonB [Fulvimonas yonginensis]|uniref:Energy transducer TonB n=1 Tax=Fulvimonas yonginensis TaxID=1495200 RepID=A0ABU8JEV5_9GAMM